MRSLRAHLTRLVCAASIPLAAGVGVGLYLFVRGVLVSRFDESLMERARALAAMAKIEDGRLEFDFSDEVMPEYQRTGSSEAFELWVLGDDSPGSVIERSKSLAGSDLAARVPRDGAIVWDGLLEGRAERFAALVFRPLPDRESAGESSAQADARLDHPLLLVAARRRADLDRTLALLAGAIAGAGVVLTGGSLIAVRAALSRGLRPVSDLAGAVASLGPTDLSRRLPASGSPPELRPIVDGTNELLGRLAAAFEREKRLAATAAHELRTPIAEVRSVAEVALSRDREAAELRQALTWIVEVAARMGDSADAVLRLARVQAGRERPQIAQVMLREAIAPAWQRWIAPLSVRGVRTELDVPEAFTVRTDGGMLRVVIENVLANTAEHTPRGGSVTARIIENGKGKELEVCNSMPAEGADGSPADNHAGLGLLIAGAMTDACGGSFSAVRTDAVFTVRVGFA